MSDYHTIRCVTCADALREASEQPIGGGVNNGGEALQLFVDNRDLLERLARSGIENELRVGNQCVSAWWFYYHREHEIAVFSEYGNRWVKP